MYRKILVGLDGSESAMHALATGLKLAALTGGTVATLSVEEHLPAYAATVGETDDARRAADRYFRDVQQRAAQLAAEHATSITQHLAAGHAAEALVRTAEPHGCDLLVLGHTGASRLHNRLLGSTADHVVERAPCAVLIVP